MSMTSEPTERKNGGNAESISFAQSGSFIARIHLYGRREERKGGRREGGGTDWDHIALT